MEINVKATMVNETAGANSFDENYTKIDENYTKMDENYAKMEENYMKMEDNFSKMEENDTKMEDNYAKMDEIHAKMGEKYTKIDENYTKMDGDYIKMDEDYTKMYEEYTKMEANDEYDVPDKNTDDVRIEYTRMTFDANVYQDVTGSHMTNAKNDIVGTTGLVPDNSHTRDSLSTNNFENSNKGATVLNEAFAQIGSANRDNRYDELQIQKAYPNEMTGLVIDTDCGKDVIAVSRNLDETNQEQSINLLQFRCHLCNSSFEFRLPSLIHIATKHETQWLELSNKNKIGNIAEFSQRVDKALAKNIQKRAKTRYNKEPNGNKDGFTPKTTSNDLAIMWSCSLCPSSFKWPDYHNKHVDMIHRNLKDIHRGDVFPCSRCQRKFSKKFNLQRHIQVVHENKPITKRTVEGIKPIECDRDQNRLEVNCRICGKTFPKKSHLQRHIKEVHETPITKRTVESVNSIDCDRDQNRHEVNCSICGKTFPKKSRLQRHITVVHEKKPITKRTAEGIKDVFPCSICQRVFSKKFNLQRHIKTHENKSTKERTAEPIECSKCGKTFTKKYSLKKHIQAMHEKKLINSNGNENGEGHLSFRCFICPLSYTSRLGCINHIEDKHSSDWLQLKKTYKVDDIDEFSKQMDTMAETLPKMILDKSSGIKYLIGTMPAASSDMGTSLPNNQTAIFTFSGTAEKLNCCALCPKRFFWETELRRHTDVHLGVGFQCSRCGRVFPRKFTLQRHIKVKHEKKIVTQRTVEEIKSTDFDGDQNSNEVNGFTLTESNGVISNLVDINTDTNQLKDKSISLTSRDKTASEEIPNRANNISQHSLGKSAHCHICGKSYSDNAHLKCHIRKVHNKKYSCHICLRLFTKSQELVAHQSVNTGHKQFQCSTCGKQYSHKGSLREHMHSHSGGQGPLTCEICEQRFPSTKSLKYHVKDKHKIKDQKCGICGKSFFGKGSLTSHMIWHTNERLYTCDICNRKFMTKPSIRKHVVRHFGGLLDGPGMTFVSCDFCGRKYQNKKLLQEHMRSHTAEIGGICEICGFMAATRATLKNHLDGHLELGERKKKKTVVYECNICHKKYAQASSLEVHKRIHANIRRYCCSICNKQFVQSHSLTVHMRVHNGSKPYRCYICGAQYTQSYPLTLHKRKKHPETIAKS